MTDRAAPRRVDPIDRAHLTGVSRPSPPIHRYAPSAHLVDLVDRYWIPVWSLAEPSTQTTLQHPVCLVVVSDGYARFYGVSRGRSSVTLEGDGWAAPTRVDPIDRAHLTGVSRPSPPIHRYAPSAHLVDLVERYWIPVWSLAEPSTQSTLQHPVCLVVVSDTYARFYGVTRGRSSVTLEGDGWAVGTMLTPAAGRLVLGRPLVELTDSWIELTELLPGDRLVADVRSAMSSGPHDPESHLAAIAAVESWLAGHLPVDEAGLLVNRLVAWLREHPEVTRVAEVARELGVSERSLQRLVEQRIGLSPKWLLQRRRLHDAVEALKSRTTGLADMAAALGYTDQAHFTHDFRTVTGMTPGEYLRDQPLTPPRGSASRP